MESILKWGILAILSLIIAVALGVLTAFPVMFLWNAVMPGLFGLKVISLTEALLLSLLCSFLFKSSSISSSK